MRIPQKIELLGQTISVKLNGKSKPKSAGKADYRKNSITIYTQNSKNKDIMFETFLHEVMHFVFYYLNTVNVLKLEGRKNILCKDEEIVDQTAHLIHQVLKSGKII